MSVAVPMYLPAALAKSFRPLVPEYVDLTIESPLALARESAPRMNKTPSFIAVEVDGERRNELCFVS